MSVTSSGSAEAAAHFRKSPGKIRQILFESDDKVIFLHLFLPVRPAGQ